MASKDRKADLRRLSAELEAELNLRATSVEDEWDSQERIHPIRR